MRKIQKKYIGIAMALILTIAGAAYAASLSSTIRISVVADLQNVLDLVTATSPMASNTTYTFTNGTGANKVQKIFSDTRTLTASSSEDIDLSGVLTDPLGATISMTKMKALVVKAAAANTNNVNLGGIPSNSFPMLGVFNDSSDIVSIKPGGMFAYISPDANGVAVTAGSADTFKLANSSGSTSVTYDIIVIGE